MSTQHCVYIYTFSALLGIFIMHVFYATQPDLNIGYFFSYQRRSFLKMFAWAASVIATVLSFQHNKYISVTRSGFLKKWSTVKSVLATKAPVLKSIIAGCVALLVFTGMGYPKKPLTNSVDCTKTKHCIQNTLILGYKNTTKLYFLVSDQNLNNFFKNHSVKAPCRYIGDVNNRMFSIINKDGNTVQNDSILFSDLIYTHEIL